MSSNDLLDIIINDLAVLRQTSVNKEEFTKERKLGYLDCLFEVETIITKAFHEIIEVGNE